jgi:hypothetical protein
MPILRTASTAPTFADKHTWCNVLNDLSLTIAVHAVTNMCAESERRELPPECVSVLQQVSSRPWLYAARG